MDVSKLQSKFQTKNDVQHRGIQKIVISSISCWHFKTIGILDCAMLNNQ